MQVIGDVKLTSCVWLHCDIPLGVSKRTGGAPANVSVIARMWCSPLPRVRDIFHALDKDGNETVLRKEFIDGMMEALPDATKKDVEKLYLLCDPNNDGEVEYGELLQVLRHVRFGAPSAEVNVK